VTVRRLGAARASGLVRESLVRGLGGVRSVLARGR
jgi:hypothetical protein